MPCVITNPSAIVLDQVLTMVPVLHVKPAADDCRTFIVQALAASTVVALVHDGLMAMLAALVTSAA